jgi:hypothetical protein
MYITIVLLRLEKLQHTTLSAGSLFTNNPHRINDKLSKCNQSRPKHEFERKKPHHKSFLA